MKKTSILLSLILISVSPYSEASIFSAIANFFSKNADTAIKQADNVKPTTIENIGSTLSPDTTAYISGVSARVINKCLSKSKENDKEFCQSEGKKIEECLRKEIKSGHSNKDAELICTKR